MVLDRNYKMKPGVLAVLIIIGIVVAVVVIWGFLSGRHKDAAKKDPYAAKGPAITPTPLVTFPRREDRDC